MDRCVLELSRFYFVAPVLSRFRRFVRRGWLIRHDGSKYSRIVFGMMVVFLFGEARCSLGFGCVWL